jgi:hypothetical protein
VGAEDLVEMRGLPHIPASGAGARSSALRGCGPGKSGTVQGLFNAPLGLK